MSEENGNPYRWRNDSLSGLSHSIEKALVKLKQEYELKKREKV